MASQESRIRDAPAVEPATKVAGTNWHGARFGTQCICAKVTFKGYADVPYTCETVLNFSLRLYLLITVVCVSSAGTFVLVHLNFRRSKCYKYHKSKEKCKEQESIQSSITTDPGHHMGTAR